MTPPTPTEEKIWSALITCVSVRCLKSVKPVEVDVLYDNKRAMEIIASALRLNEQRIREEERERAANIADNWESWCGDQAGQCGCCVDIAAAIREGKP